MKFPRLKAAAWAAFHSLWITGLGVWAGVSTAALHAGQAGNPQAYLLYCQSHYFPWVLTNLIPPAIRATQAFQNTPKETPTP